jgi:hypothetical protein
MLGSHWLKETPCDEGCENNELPKAEISFWPKEISVRKELSSSEISAKSYDETIKNITAEFKDHIPEDQETRIREESEHIKPTVMTPEAYCQCFPESDPNVLGHYDAEGQVYIKSGSAETVSHVVTHEAMHLTSYKEIDDSKIGSCMYRSGIREAIFNEDGLQEDKNHALNEGITELYAVRELQRRGEFTSIEAVSAYPEAQKAASELQDAVGPERIRDAYFGGNTEQLKKEVNRLCYDDETAWDRYTKNVDVLEFGTDEEQIRNARRELTIQNAIMLSCKESEMWATHEEKPE